MNEQKTTSELMKEGYTSEHSTAPFNRSELRQGLFKELETLYRVLGNCEVAQARSDGAVVTVTTVCFNEIVEILKKRANAVNFRITKSFESKGV